MVDIVDIIPKLNNEQSNDNIEMEFKNLYKKAEALACDRLGIDKSDLNGKSLLLKLIKIIY